MAKRLSKVTKRLVEAFAVKAWIFTELNQYDLSEYLANINVLRKHPMYKGKLDAIKKGLLLENYLQVIADEVRDMEQPPLGWECPGHLTMTEFKEEIVAVMQQMFRLPAWEIIQAF